MKTYIVLYREPMMNPAYEPLGFICQAEDTEHAEEQCENAYPEADIVWIEETDNLWIALDTFYTEGMV